MLWQIFLVLMAVFMLISGFMHLADGDYGYGFFGIVFGFVCARTFLFFRRARADRGAFLAWLVENIEGLGTGSPQYYQNIPLTLESEVVSYQFAFSFLFSKNSITIFRRWAPRGKFKKDGLLSFFFSFRMVGFSVRAYLYNSGFVQKFNRRSDANCF